MDSVKENCLSVCPLPSLYFILFCFVLARSLDLCCLVLVNIQRRDAATQSHDGEETRVFLNQPNVIRGRKDDTSTCVVHHRVPPDTAAVRMT